MQSDNGTCRRTPRWIWALVVLIGVAVIPGAAVVQSQERKVADGTTLPVSNSVLVPNDHLAHDTGTSRPMPPSVPIRSFKVFNGSTVGEQVPVTRKTTSGGGFNINRTPQKSLDEISKLAFTEEEQKKIADEFKDHFWQSCDARRHLQHCENKKVLVKFRYAALPPELAEMLAGDAELSEAASNADWRVSTHQVSLSDLVPILKELRNKKAIVTPPSFTWMFKDDLSSSVGAFIPKAVRMEISHVSMLDPERTTVGKVNLKEGVSVSGSVESIEAASVSLKTNLQFDRAFNGTQRQLPLRTGSGPVEIDVPEVASLVESSSFSLGAGDVQIVRAVRNDAPEVQMFAIISVTNHPAWVKDMQSLTLKSVLGIKKQIEEQSTMPMGSSYALRTRGVLGKVEVMAFPKALKALKAQKELPPMSLLLRCGNPDEVKSLNTQIGLTKDSVLTVEGEVASQQITTDSVQVNGKNFVFKNEEEGSFSAKAASGSLSFNRAGPIEDTLRLSLRSDATLQFAGVEFSADSIECIQDRIEASGNVKVSIPEISSKVSAGRVILNLKSLAFDFDGDVKVERNIDEDSFPFLVKGKHVAWSLVTGEMQTDVRHSNPRRSARQSNAFGNPTFPFNQTRFGESVFQRQESGTRFNAGGPSPVQPNQTQSNSHFRPFNRTSGRN